MADDAEGKEMTMVERVARAIYGASIRDRAWSLLTAEKRAPFLDEARAAIAALREPTKPMLMASEDVVIGYDDFAVGDGTLYLSYGGINGRDGFYDYAIAAHHAMIDAALKETA